MSKEKTKGNKILEDALRSSCESYCDRYPRYEGEIDLGKDYADYERQLLQLSKSERRKRGGSVSARSSVIAASLILFCACSMALFWTYLIFHGTPSEQPTPPDLWTTESKKTSNTNGTVESTPNTTSGTTPGTVDPRPTQSTMESTETQDTSGSVRPPERDPVETPATYVFLQNNGDGLQIKVTVHGYRRSDRGKLFYVKNNEYITVDVQVANFSAVPVYQWMPRNHEIDFDISHGKYQWNAALPDVGKYEQWTVEPGETYEWQMQFVAGEMNYDLPDDGKIDLNDFELYGEEIYSEGICTFSGNISFAYAKSEDEPENSQLLSVPVSFNVLYVSSEPNA